jgi:membrane-associated phospholipid phosphatase
VIAALIGLLAVFLLVLWHVQSGGALVTFDGVVNAGLARLRTRPALAGGAWISQVGTGAAGAVLCLVASGLFWSDGRARLIAPIWVTYGGAQATTWSLKFITARVRPDFLEGITAASPSFPSAHATVSVAVFGFLGLAIADGVTEGRAVVLAVAALLILAICLSRMLLSLHYFSDVVAGAAVGLFWILLGWRLASI